MEANMECKSSTKGKGVWITDTLGVQAHQIGRKMDQVATCSICGMEDETSHHDMISSTRVPALRHSLKEVLCLPLEHNFNYTGREWVLVLLSNVNDDLRAHVVEILEIGRAHV